MVRLIPYEEDLDRHCEISARWANDERIRHLFMIGHPETGEFEMVSAEKVRSTYTRSRLSGRYFRWMIDDSGHLLGEVSLMLNSKLVLSQKPHTGWISIVIGELGSQRSGVGTQALKLLETKAQESGCEHIELGTFEFNVAAQKFYLKNGYQEFHRIPDFVFWNGRRWCDIRMIKTL